MRIPRFLSVILLLSCSAPAAGQSSYELTNPPPTLKVQPTCKDAGPAAVSLRIAMARGEYEPVQLVVSATSGDVKTLRVAASDLRGPNGAVIPAKRVVVTPLGFVNCKKLSPGARLVGEVPDVVLPDRPMDIPAGRRQPFYVTVQTLPKDVPGEYKGTVRITARNAPATTLPLTVRVYSLVLPVRSHMRTAFVTREAFRQFMSSPTDHDEFVRAAINYAKVMLSYRVSPDFGWAPRKNEDGSYDFSDFDKLLSATVPLGLTGFDIGASGSMASTPDTKLAKAAAEHFKAKGWWDLHYCYGWDEASGDVVRRIPVLYKALIKAVPDIKIVQTGWSPNEPVKDLVKIWCPLTAWIDFNACREAQKKGEEIWWYVCCLPPAPHANVFVDSPGIDQRILGWQSFKEGIQGFLYWGMDYWTGNTPPLDKYDRANYANWNPLSYGDTFNGDGYLLYPGQHDSPLASVRLVGLRDGFEDYDVFTEARALAEKGAPGAEKLNKLLDFGAPLIKSMTEFTQDGNDLLARREQILKAAEELAAK